MTKDQELRERAMKVVPGGMYGQMQTNLFPADYPQFFTHAHGSRMRDVNGREYIDYMCAFGLNLFGYGDPAINEAFIKRMEQGDIMSGAPDIMVELAEVVTGMITHADWSIFVKNGTDATSLGAMIARQYTGKEKLIIARGAYHGAAAWCAIRPGGTTRADQENKIMCDYNDVESLERAVAEAGDNLAGIFATPFKHDVFLDQELVDPAYARRARELCDKHDALLIIDDVRAGFRMAKDCSWSTVGVHPDLSAWGKCIANGHPISALVGSDRARKAATEVYAAGSFWFQAAPMAAALVTLERIRTTDYLATLQKLGDSLREGLTSIAASHGVGFRQSGPAIMPIFLFDNDPDWRKNFHWCSQMLAQGIYVHPWHNMFMNTSLTAEDIAQTLDAADKAFASLVREGNHIQPSPAIVQLLESVSGGG